MKLIVQVGIYHREFLWIPLLINIPAVISSRLQGWKAVLMWLDYVELKRNASF